MENGWSSCDLLENILVLKRSPLFSAVSTGELRAVANVVEQIEFDADQRIVREGDVGDSFYLIKEGSVRIEKRTGSGGSVVLANLRQGDCFGEMAVIDEEVRSASVVASERCVLLCIKRDDLIEVIGSYPRIGVELLRIFVKRLRAANEKIESLSVERRGVSVGGAG